MVAVAEAAAVAGAEELDSASPEQLAKAWELVGRAAGLSADELTAEIAAQARVPVAALDAADPRAEILVPATVARRRNVVPLRCSDRTVAIATSNPLSQDVKREIAGLTGRTVDFEIASPRRIAEKVAAAYGEARAGVVPEVPGSTPQPLGPHVLVVDDEPGQRALFRSILEEAGFRVSVATDGPAALSALDAEGGFDLVTLDYWMDRMNGLRVLQQIRSSKTTSAVPVIMVTGADDRRIEMSLFEAGADDFIAKPVDPPLFVLRVQAVLRRRRYA